MQHKTKDDILTRLAAALDERGKAKPYRAEANPVGDHSLKDLLNGAGVATSADHLPAKSMAPQSGVGYDMEVARNQGRTEAHADKSAKRMAAARTRAAKKAQFDAIAESPVIPSPERMRLAWAVIEPMAPIVTRIASGKQSWASRFLGSVVEDMGQVTLESMALVLAKSDKDLDLLAAAARELGEQSKRKAIPGDQLTDDERKERKEMAKARKWLMGMANNRVMGALVDTYTSQRNLRWENLDVVATVMASIGGVGEDPMTARFKADRAPAFLGTKFPKPGGIDPHLLSTAISAAITARGLDRVVEILLAEENRRSDGSTKWSKCAEDLFLASPGLGGWAWDAVVTATAHHKKPKRSRADAARTHVRNLFDWLPGCVVAVTDAFDFQAIGHYAGNCTTTAINSEGEAVVVRRTNADPRIRAVLASDFELFYKGEEPPVRHVLVPALKFETVAEAKRVLAEHLGLLVTGEDVVSSVVNG